MTALSAPTARPAAVSFKRKLIAPFPSFLPDARRRIGRPVTRQPASSPALRLRYSFSTAKASPLCSPRREGAGPPPRARHRTVPGAAGGHYRVTLMVYCSLRLSLAGTVESVMVMVTCTCQASSAGRSASRSPGLAAVRTGGTRASPARCKAGCRRRRTASRSSSPGGIAGGRHAICGVGPGRADAYTSHPHPARSALKD
jgi:hypothetical protein